MNNLEILGLILGYNLVITRKGNLGCTSGMVGKPLPTFATFSPWSLRNPLGKTNAIFTTTFLMVNIPPIKMMMTWGW
jgi:hypothetical protein